MLKVAFFKSNKRQLITKLIDWWTGGVGYSHVELQFPNGQCFSSDYTVGVRIARVDIESSKWDVVDLDLTEEEVVEVYKKCLSMKGAKYDWLGIIFNQFLGRFSTELKLDEKDKWWCSEAIAYALGIEKYRISPNKLYTHLKSLPHN